MASYHSSVLLNTGSMSNTTPRNGKTRWRTTWPSLYLAIRMVPMAGLHSERDWAKQPRPFRGAVARSQAVTGRRVGILGGDQAGEVDHDLCLLPGGVVLHLAVDHHGAGAVRHGGEDFSRERDLSGIGRKHPLGDRDLRGVQRPGAGTAHQERVAELRLAGVRIGEVAERAVERLDPGGRAGVDHPGDGVVP